jgi:hypothetical protein
MRIHAIGLGITICLTAMSASPAFTQTLEATSQTATPATVANVYIQTRQGVNLYNVTAAGELALVKGSPFLNSGQMEGITGKYLISVGTTNLHTYLLASNGAVEKQVSVTDTQKYSGSECGTTADDNNDPNGAVLDHTGKYFYVQLYGATVNYYFCDAWQAYRVESTGKLSFLNDAVETMDWIASEYIGTQPTYVPTITSNDKLAYAGNNLQHEFAAFTFPSGLIETNDAYKTTGPALGPWSHLIPLRAEADPASHLAVLLCFSDANGGIRTPLLLASYTVNNTTGDIASTNTLQNMPNASNFGSCFGSSMQGMSMSRSGRLLAVYGNPGLQLFHFNGAAPIAPYSSVLLPTDDIDQVAWDNNNHMYVLSYETQELHVFTATPTSVTEVAGSPYSVVGAYGIHGLIVVPK